MKHDLYISLLEKELSGQLASEEKAALEAWLASSPDHRRMAESVRKAWELSRDFSEELDLDLDADFKKIKDRIAVPTEKPTAKVVPLHRRWLLRVAAALVLLALGPYVVKKFMQPAVQYEVVFTKDSPRKEVLELADGSRVWLNANSRLSYFMSAVGKERRVKLEGEAFFEVARDESKPFVVETPSGEVTVLGTSFSVNEPSGGDAIAVHVASGKVKFQPKGSNEHLLLQKNEQGIFFKKENKLEKSADPSLNTLAWHTRRLVFQNTTLKEALLSIGNLYQVTVKNDNPSIDNCPITVTFDQKPLDAVLATLQALLGAAMEKTSDGNYLMKGGRCE